MINLALRNTTFKFRRVRSWRLEEDAWPAAFPGPDGRGQSRRHAHVGQQCTQLYSLPRHLHIYEQPEPRQEHAYQGKLFFS